MKTLGGLGATVCGSALPRVLRRNRAFVPRLPLRELALVDALESVARSISTAQNVHEVMTVIVEAAKRFTASEKVVVCLVDEEAPRLAMDKSTLVVRGALSSHPQEWWEHRLSAIIDDVFLGTAWACDVDRHDGAWLLAVPLRIQDRPLGVLAAFNATDHRLLPEHSAFLSILAALAAVSIANARLAEEGQYSMLSNERERIAREMHDGVVQSLFSVSLGLELAKKQVARDPLEAERTLEDLEGQLSASAGELRRLIYDLRPMRLGELGLVGSIRTWIREATRGTGVTGTLEVEGSAYPLSRSQEVCLYRVAKEAVSNAVRHSGAAAVAVRLTFLHDAVLLTVTDDGKGFAHGKTAPGAAGTGAGLRNIHERVAAQGGRVSISSAPGSGTTIRALLPKAVSA